MIYRKKGADAGKKGDDKGSRGHAVLALMKKKRQGKKAQGKGDGGDYEE